MPINKSSLNEFLIMFMDYLINITIGGNYWVRLNFFEN